MLPADPAVHAFIEAASVPIGAAHASGGLEQAEAIRAAQPEVTRASLHAAAVIGDAEGVRDWLARDATLATTAGGPRQWDPLTVLCFSRYLRLDRTRADDFLRAARLLLDAGASASSGFFDSSYSGKPEWESVLYGAAGIAHDAALARLLLAHGADPNDVEVVYHSPESYDLGPIEALVEHGRLTPDSLVIMLVRKHDWHDLEGVRYLLAHGADPNRMSIFGVTALHHAVRRDNHLAIVELLMAHDANPRLPMRHPHGAAVNAIDLAAWRGRGDLLALFASSGYTLDADSRLGLVAACASGEHGNAPTPAASPTLLDELGANAGELLGVFAGNGNVDGLRCLLGHGLPVNARWPGGDGYFGVPRDSTALHVAAWRARHDAVRFLIANGADVDAQDGAGQTPLQLAVRACVDSYWRDRRAPDSIEALLQAGANPHAVSLPTGYDEADRLLAR